MIDNLATVLKELRKLKKDTPHVNPLKFSQEVKKAIEEESIIFTEEDNRLRGNADILNRCFDINWFFFSL